MITEGNLPLEAIAAPLVVWDQVGGIQAGHIRRVQESTDLARFQARDVAEALIDESGVLGAHDPEADLVTRTVAVVHDIFPQIAALDLSTHEPLRIQSQPGMQKDEFFGAMTIAATANDRTFESRWHGVHVVVNPGDTLEQVLSRYSEGERILDRAQDVEGVPQG